MRRRRISFYVEWTGENRSEAISALLQRNGACCLGADEDMDLEYIPGPSVKHAHTVFRFCIDRAKPAYELLSAVAEHPDVYSVSELLGLFR